MLSAVQKKTSPDITQELNRRQARRELARRHLLDFLLFFPPALPYYIGKHTRKICDRLEKAILDLENGISSYILVHVPPRHGKSDIVSRRFPPWFLGRNPDLEVILATYGANLAQRMSRDARRCVGLERYYSVFEQRLSQDSRSMGDWELEGRGGRVHAVGIGGPITGHGASVLVIDDYCKNREEAESEIRRKTTWDSFRNDLMTRLAPVHLVVITATRWHEDDMIGSILEAQKDDPDFPEFEYLRFPAQDDEGKFLFLSRFSKAWYKKARASVGDYGWFSLYQGEPRRREGNLLKTDGIQYYDELPQGKSFAWVRYWDAAHSQKERIKDDPDFSAGVKLSITLEEGLEHLWIDDVVRGQWDGPERDRKIKAVVERDGRAVPLGLEMGTDSIDYVKGMKLALRGKVKVETTIPRVDKVIRAGPLEAIFEAGHVHMRRAEWNGPLLSEITAFPMGKKDDQVDGISGGYEVAKRRMRTVRIERL